MRNARSWCAPPHHRLPPRRPDLRGQPLPAASQPGCRVPHPQGRGLTRLPPSAQARKPHGTFKDYEVGFVHVDVKHLPKLRDGDGLTGKRYLYVANDRASRFVHLAVKDDETTASAVAFLEEALTAFPFQITQVLTDRGSCFTADAFESACTTNEFRHRKTRPYTPQTNGMVERFNGRVQREVLGITVYSHSDLETLLLGFNVAYNGRRPARPQRPLTRNGPAAATRSKGHPREQVLQTTLLHGDLDERRIASPELLPRAVLLPHLKCSPAAAWGANMRKVSMATRRELIVAIRGRYASVGRGEKIKILDEFVALTGFHRKHAVRLLRGAAPPPQVGSRPGRRVYGEDVRALLVTVWEASDRICGKRLQPLLAPLIEAMERHGHAGLSGDAREQLLTMSPATIDRALRDIKVTAIGPRRRKASTAIRRSVPIRTFSDWDNPAPGFVEADLVSHSGPFAKGAFSQTLVLTDIATGWTECVPLLVREQTVLTTALTELRRLLPFPLLGFDTDNDGVFMNETVRDYCFRDGIEFTRCRPYRKNDQAFVEQKNGAIVRKMVGYRRFEGLKATHELAKLYASIRLFINFFQPSFKLKEKHRDGAKVIKRYHRPATPYQRLLADVRTSEETRNRIKAPYVTLDPVLLLRDIRRAQERLVAIADTAPADPVLENGAVPLGAFLEGLRIAWRSGEVRPTAPSKVKRERRRPDPILAVSVELKTWWDAEPGRTSRELLEQIQAKYPGMYPDGLIRTVQRRVKIWRAATAHELVFGPFAETERAIEGAEIAV